MKLIECRGAPRARGRQYGEQARDEIQRNLNLRAPTWAAIDAETFTARTVSVLEQYLPDVLAELRGIAEGAQAEFSQILLTNQVDTFDDDGNAQCTPVVLRESPVGPIVAKNNDGPPGEDHPFVILKSLPDRGVPSIQVTYAGWLCGLDALNAEGLACTHGSVGSKFTKGGPRVDIRLQSYALLQSCRTTAEFIASLSRAPLTGKGFGLAVGDATGHTAMLDAAVPFVAVRDENRPFAYSTNLYRAPGLEEADRRPPAQRPVCLYRQGYLHWLAATRPPTDLAAIQTLLRSHEPWAPCRHGGPHGSLTLWSLIALPRQRQLLLADGPPCTNPYLEYPC